MAKSIRSKSKLRAKSIKRKGEFANIVDTRNDRLATKMQEELIKQRAIAAAKKAEEGTEEQQEEKEAAMDVDQKKVSTSGWRDSRKQIYKKTKIKKKANKSMKF